MIKNDITVCGLITQAATLKASLTGWGGVCIFINPNLYSPSGDPESFGKVIQSNL